MVASASIMYHSKRAPMLCTDIEGVIMLRFMAPEMELAYQEEILDSGVHSRARRVLVLGGIGLLWCVNFGFGPSDMQWAARGATLAVSAFYAGYALLLKRDPYIVGFNHGRVMLASYCYAAIVASLTRDRWARLIQSEELLLHCLPMISGVQDGKCRATGLMEASCILSLSGLLNLSAFFTQLPTIHCFLLLNFVVIAYVGCAWGLGSLEHQLLEPILEDGWEDNRLLHHALVGAGLYTLGILTLTSRRALEVKDRRAFASAYLKLAKREWEAREDLKAVARQNELEQRLHALMTPMGSMDEPLPGSHHNTEDSALPPHSPQHSGQQHNNYLTPSEASYSSGVERLRSARYQQQATLSRSDKNTDSAPHSSSDGTQESCKSKSKRILGPPSLSRTWKSKDSGHEEAPWLKTVPPPPVLCVAHSPSVDQVKVETIDAASVDSTAATGVTLAPHHQAAMPSSVSASSPSSPSPSQLTTGPLGFTPGRKRLSVMSATEAAASWRFGSQASGGQQAKVPNTRLVTQMSGHTADWLRIRRMAERIKQADYSLHMYFQDCVRAFPELALFTCGEHAETGRMTASGRSAEVEYQRTIGALFAVYWLLRLDTDGKEAFCYGVDDDWNVRNPPPIQEVRGPAGGEHSPMLGAMVRSGSIEQLRKNMAGSADVASWRHSASSEPPQPPAKKLFSQMTAEEKRLSFMQNASWSQFQELVDQAGCGDDNPDRIDNIMAMLCLTSFHDIMKVEELLPTVQPDHAPYRGYQVGITIQDHDAALSYVLEHFPEVLPSFGGLPTAAKELVIFSQGKMHFNHGWFVQAEAPPGIMLSKFKQVLSNGASPRHVGFYFFHWITDLAGAEATPLGGGEKFVLKFPHDVLASFLWSMPFLGKLVDMTETVVVESYLKERWRMLNPEVPLPTGKSAIARMRLAVMVQEVGSTLQAFDELNSLEMTVLSEELSRTGVKEQYYSEDCMKLGGPAFLVYYGPALMQQNCSSLEDLTRAMMILSRVLIAARRLWPAQAESEAETVTIQVSELKSRSLLDITGSPAADVRQVWVLIRQNDKDGTVMLRQAIDLNYLVNNGQQFVVLDFSSRTPFAIEGEQTTKRPESADNVAQPPEKKTIVSVHSAPTAPEKATPAEPQAQDNSPRAKTEEGGSSPSNQRGEAQGEGRQHAGRASVGRGSIGRHSTESCNTYEFMPCVPSHHNSMLPEVQQVASQKQAAPADHAKEVS